MHSIYTKQPVFLAHAQAMIFMIITPVDDACQDELSSPYFMIKNPDPPFDKNYYMFYNRVWFLDYLRKKKK